MAITCELPIGINDQSELSFIVRRTGRNIQTKKYLYRIDGASLLYINIKTLSYFNLGRQNHPLVLLIP
jgi:hypothetical protein